MGDKSTQKNWNFIFNDATRLVSFLGAVSVVVGGIYHYFSVRTLLDGIQNTLTKHGTAIERLADAEQDLETKFVRCHERGEALKERVGRMEKRLK